MSIVKHSPSFNSSAASSQIDHYDDMETIKVKNYLKDLLKSRIFLGRYVERRLINQHIGYRDIVLLSAAEVDFKKDLLEACNKLRSSTLNSSAVGIIDAESTGISASGICLWTEIENQPFGPFWFQVRSVKFKPDEIMVTLKCLRYISENYLEIEPILTGGGVAKKSKDVKAAKLDNSAEALSETYNEIVGTLRSSLSIRNVKEFVTFIFAFVIAIFTGSTAFINFLGNFVLALIREFSILLKNSTPMLLGLLDFFSKIVGGFYILMAMIFRPSNPPPNRRRITYNQPPPNTEQYDHRQFD
jgi:hypothetical protein